MQFTQLKGHTKAVTSLHCKSNQEGYLLLSGSEDGTSRLWDVRQNNGRSIRCFIPNMTKDAISCVRFTDNNTVLLGSGTTIYSFDTRKDDIIMTEPITSITIPNQGDNEINSISCNGGSFCVSDDQGLVHLIQSNKINTLPRTFTNICMSAQFRPKNPTELLTIGTDMSLESSFIRTNWKTKSTTKFEFKTIFQNPTGGQICNPPMAQSLDCSKDGTKAIVGLGNGKCVLFDLTKKGVDSIIDILEGHDYSVHQCYFYKKFVCTAGLDDKIQLWDISVCNGKNKRAKVVWKYDHVMDDKRVNCIAIQEPDQLFIGDESNVIVGLTIKV